MIEAPHPPHVATYREQGFAVVRGVFAPAEVAVLAEAFDAEWRAGVQHGRSFRHGNLYYRIAQDPALGPIVRLAQWPSYHRPELEQVRRDPRMLAIVAPLIGTDVKQIINQLHWKPPGAAMADFAYHQDCRFRKPREAYRRLASSYVQTGIAVDPHRAVSGAMRMLPRSHLLGELPLNEDARVSSAEASEAALAAVGLAAADLVDLELEPGDVALWHPYMVHGSGANRTANDRRFYINGYVAAAACDRGEWAFRDGKPVSLGAPQLVHYEELLTRPEPHYPDV